MDSDATFALKSWKRLIKRRKSEVIQMLDIVENIIEEKKNQMKQWASFEFYRPAAMLIEVLFRKSQFVMKE